MNNRIDRFLLGTLWLVVVILCAVFWFNIRFGFNLFSGSHWQYLADAQVGPATITPWFYISMIIFFLTAIIGLYLLLHTRRQTKISSTEQSRPELPALPAPSAFAQPISDKLNAGAPEQPVAIPENISRPPRPGLSSAPLVIPTAHTPNITAAPTPSLNISTPPMNLQKPATGPNPETVARVQDIIKNAGYILRRGPVIGGLNLDIWALGTDEVLLTGIICPVSGDITAAEGGMSKWKSSNGETFDSPVWQLVGVVQKLQSLFMETLDEIAINTRAFVIMDGGNIVNRANVQSIWDAFGCIVFNNVSEFAEYMNMNPNAPLAPEDAGDFDAYADYIDTVATHMNNKA